MTKGESDAAFNTGTEKIMLGHEQEFVTVERREQFHRLLAELGKFAMGQPCACSDYVAVLESAFRASVEICKLSSQLIDNESEYLQ